RPRTATSHFVSCCSPETDMKIPPGMTNSPNRLAVAIKARPFLTVRPNQILRRHERQPGAALPVAAGQPPGRCRTLLLLQDGHHILARDWGAVQQLAGQLDDKLLPIRDRAKSSDQSLRIELQGEVLESVRCRIRTVRPVFLAGQRQEGSRHVLQRRPQW